MNQAVSRSMPVWKIVVFFLVLFLFVDLLVPGPVVSYEWMDVIQDNSPLLVPSEILKRPVPELSGTGPSLLFQKLQKEWFLRKRYVALGNDKLSDLLLNRIHEQLVDLGAIRVRTFAASLLREADFLSLQGDYQKALSLCRKAEDFAGDLPETHWKLAELLWRQSPANLFRVLEEAFRTGKSLVLSFEFAALLIMDGLFLLLMAGVVFFGVFYLVVLLRYGRMLYHDLYELLPGDPSRAGLLIIMACLLSAPLLLGGGLFGVCVLWLILLWSYSGRKERFIHLFFLFFLLVTPLWTDMLQRGVEHLSSDRMQSILGHRDGDADDAAVAGLARLTEQFPKDDAAFFMLGTAYKKRGEYAKAKKVLEKAIHQNGNEADYYNNLGNVYYAMRNLKKAVEMYNEAIALDPREAAFHFNLSAVQRELFLLDKSDSEYFKARKLNPAEVSYYVKILGPNYNRMVIDTVLPDRNLWNGFFKTLFSVGPADRSQGGVLKKIIVRGGLVLLILPVALLLHLLRRFRGYSRRCGKCGVVFCRKCQSHRRREAICSQCAYIFGKGAGVDVKMRTRKIIEILSYKERKVEKGRILGILIPGGGHIYFGRPVTGFVILFLVVCLLVSGFFRSILPPGVMVFEAVPWSRHLWLLLPVMVVYLLSCFHLYRLQD
ncbi:MAG: tetratricopeptide repeat protein [Deltaproteobacteria bacterium]|nr:tetratricopeptide repeat protein [Deltaproteobacteria bacterium]